MLVYFIIDIDIKDFFLAIPRNRNRYKHLRMTQDRISGNTIFEHTLCFGHVFRKILFQLSNCHKRKRKIDCVSCGRETMGTYVKVFYIKQYTKMETG